MKLAAALVTVIALSGSIALAQEAPALDPRSLSAALAAKPEGADADRLADRIRAYFGGRDVLMRGAPARADELTVAFAIEAPNLPATGPAPRAVADHGMFALPLIEGGHERPLRGRRESHSRRRVHVALRSRRRAIRRRPARGVRNASRRARTRRRAQGDGQADAAVEQQDFRGNHARLVGLCAGAVQRGQPRRR